MRRLPVFILACALAGTVPAASAATADPEVRPAYGEVERFAGQNRYETAFEVSRSVFEPPVPVVFVATGDRFPDALSGGPLAASIGAPIVLTQPTHLPEVTERELARLRPGRIVILGGVEAVGAEVEAALAEFTTGAVERLQGPTRYETAAEVALEAFTRPVEAVFVATGFDYPDALSGAAAGAALGGPILLTRPDELPEAARDALEQLEPGRIIVLGGDQAVSEGVVNDLGFYTDSEVERWAGDDRFETSARIASQVFTAEETTAVFVATGSNFPDALVGASAAGAYAAPVVLVPRFLVPDKVGAELARLMPGGLDVFVLGGDAVISEQVESDMAAYANPTLSRVTVTVTDATSGGPVGDATVDLVALDRDETTNEMSGPNGVAEFTEVVWGRFTVAVSRPGYASAAPEIEVKPGADDQVPVELARVASITGRVVQTGSDVQVVGATVTAQRIVEGAPVGDTYEATTDLNGRFLLSTDGGLQAGAYDVRVTHPEYKEGSASATVVDGEWADTGKIGLVVNA